MITPIPTPRALYRIALAGLLAANLAYGDCSKALDKCDLAIKAADTVIAEQKQSVDLLGKHVDDLNKRIVDEQNSATTMKWLYLVGGIIAGGAAVYIIRK